MMAIWRNKVNWRTRAMDIVNELYNEMEVGRMGKVVGTMGKVVGG